MRKNTKKGLVEKQCLRSQASEKRPSNPYHASMALEPAVQAAATLESYDRLFCEFDLPDIVFALEAQTEKIKNGDLGRCEEMLATQAHALDAMFNSMARRAVNSEYRDTMECYMKLALRAQSQCRATVEALSEMKQPRNVAFVRQANIANGPQQINNGGPANEDASRTEEKNILKSKLLSEQLNGPQMDTGATCQTVGVNPPMETLW